MIQLADTNIISNEVYWELVLLDMGRKLVFSRDASLKTTANESLAR